MNPRKESRHEQYDVIVVGSGLGGLSAAALLAKAGRKVLVLERHDLPGGYAHHFRRKKYIFDAAVHVSTGCEPGTSENTGLIDRLLRLLGVRDSCRFLPVQPFYGAVFAKPPRIHISGQQLADRRVPVVDRRLVGVVSQADIALRVRDRQQTAEVFQQISRSAA